MKTNQQTLPSFNRIFKDIVNENEKTKFNTGYWSEEVYKIMYCH
jgi:hypothetical protein